MNDTYLSYLGNASPRSHPYAPSLSSSASSSTSSVFSEAASQASNSTSLSSSSWGADEWSSGSRPIIAGSLASLAPIGRVSTFPQYQAPCRDAANDRVLPPLRMEVPMPTEQRQHPRRSSSTVSRQPPQLVRQSDRKVNFVDCLVDSATQMVEVIWPTSVPASRCESSSGRGVLPLRTFIQETLRRSRTSYSTLQVALYYLILIKAHVPKHDFTMEQPEDVASVRALQCGRRMFLAALILASKYLQDRNYSARAWSKISGLKVCEINTNEMAFLAAVNWRLHITDPVWDKWQEIVLRHTPSNPPPSPGGCLPNTWKHVIPCLTPELDIVDVTPKTHIAPTTPVRPTMQSYATQYPVRSPMSERSSGSQESTPTPSQYRVPRFLEPKPDLLPPTPCLPRLGPLPTPTLTPQSTVANTPAAGAMTFGMRRPSMCSAMAQAQSSSLARSCVDQYTPSVRNGLEAYHFPSRRPSLAPSTASSASSPESMITDNSRSSRASSISSVSSVGWAPNQAKLARLATCRSARLPYPALSKCSEYAVSDVMSSPDLDSFHLDDSDATPVKVDSPVEISIPAAKANRKRGRSNTDLQQNIRHLLQDSRSTSYGLSYGSRMVLPDRSVAQAFVPTPSGAELKGLQSPKSTVPERRMPYQKEFGKKRTCCGTEVVHGFQRSGPGMWEGVL